MVCSFARALPASIVRASSSTTGTRAIARPTTTRPEPGTGAMTNIGATRFQSLPSVVTAFCSARVAGDA